MEGTLTTVRRVLARRKTATCPGDAGQQVSRCLTVVDVTCLGLSTVLGVGVFVLLAHASKEHAGPSVILSFLVAAVASCLGGLCYSELATRFPRGGSAYAYTYATTGELCAFLVAWSAVLDYGVGAALAGKAWSALLDRLCNGSVRSALRFHSATGPSPSFTVEGSRDNTDAVHAVLPGLETGPDLLALAPLAVVCLAISLKTKWSCVLNNVLVIGTLLSLTGIVLVGIFNLDAQNWLGGAGFFPNGIAGVFWGASSCFFSFLGYDVMASSTDAMVHRSRILPVAISFTFLIGLLASFACAASLTLLVPAALLDFNGPPLLQAFEIRGVHGMAYLVTMGATAGLTATILACLFALVRLLQSLSHDGLLFACLGGTGTLPALAPAAASIAFIASLADAEALLAVLGLGTLVNFASVSVSVLCLRYGVAERLPLECGELSRESTVTMASFAGELYENADYPSSPGTGELPSPPAVRNYGSTHDQGRTMAVDFVNEAFVSSLVRKREPTDKSASATAILLSLVVGLMVATGLLTVQAPRFVPVERRWALELVACALFAALLICLAVVARQPRHGGRPVKNAVPCVPLLPVCALWMDVHLVVCLPYTAWVAGIVWTLIGLLVYMGYSVWHSTERQLEDARDVALSDVTEETEDNAQQREMLVEAC